MPGPTDSKNKNSPTIRTQYGPASTPEVDSTPLNDSLASWHKSQAPQDLHKVIGHLQPTIDKALATYAPNAGPIVADRARLLASQAVKTFDPTKGANLHTHVFRQLQAVQRLAPTITDPLVMPERLRRDRGQVAQHIREVEDNLGREASDEEVAELAELPVNRVTKVRRMLHANIPESALEDVDEDEGEGADIIAHQQTPMDDWHDAVYHDLGDIDRVIMQYRTGYRGYDILPNQEIARRLKVSPAAVTQRARRIQERLDEFNG